MSTNPTPSAAAARELNRAYIIIFSNGDIEHGRAVKNDEIAAIIDKHYAAQREAIGKAIEALERLYPSLPGAIKCHKPGVQFAAKRYDTAFTAYRLLHAVHSGGSTGQAKEGGAS